MFIGFSNATYTLQSINTTVYLSPNNSARVSEAIHFTMNNDSVYAYNIDRSAVNLTLSNWEGIAGTWVEPHIINPRTGIYNFNLLPGPVHAINSTKYSATIYLNYYVNNVTMENQTGPRTFIYTFQPSVLNFQHGSGGVFLGTNTNLTIVLPTSSYILSIYPLPDYPIITVHNATNTITQVSWYRSEPLYNFKLIFQVKESLVEEVVSFFSDVYNTLGIFVYILIIILIVSFILYTYYKVH